MLIYLVYLYKMEWLVLLLNLDRKFIWMKMIVYLIKGKLWNNYRFLPRPKGATSAPSSGGARGGRGGFRGGDRGGRGGGFRGGDRGGFRGGDRGGRGGGFRGGRGGFRGGRWNIYKFLIILIIFLFNFLVPKVYSYIFIILLYFLDFMH